MPANKNAVIRYQILDELLSDRHHYYTRKDLCDACNRKLVEKGYPEVTKRTIELDLHDIDLEFEDMEIDWDFVKDGKHIVRYADQSKSIFTKKLSTEETQFLNEVLNTLGQFSGLDSFEWLSDLQSRLKKESSENHDESDRRTIISFSKNPYLNNENGSQVSNALAGLFSAIANKVVVNIEYHKFGAEKASQYKVYPYLLKQYNDRWYLMCQLVDAERDFLMSLALDRIISFSEMPDIPYKECYCDIDERFEDIVGITYIEENELQPILFAVSKEKAPYIITKPVHGSQIRLPEFKQAELRNIYPELNDYMFFTVECIPNNELKECFFTFDKDFVVLSKGIQDEIYKELKRQTSLYESVMSADNSFTTR